MTPLVDHLVGTAPRGPVPLSAAGPLRSARARHLAELVREQVLLRTREELPHAVEVEVAEMFERDDGLLEIEACLWAEGETQKAILIGAQGRMIKSIGTAARKQIEAAVGRHCHLALTGPGAQGLATRRAASWIASASNEPAQSICVTIYRVMSDAVEGGSMRHCHRQDFEGGPPRHRHGGGPPWRHGRFGWGGRRPPRAEGAPRRRPHGDPAASGRGAPGTVTA